MVWEQQKVGNVSSKDKNVQFANVKLGKAKFLMEERGFFRYGVKFANFGENQTFFPRKAGAAEFPRVG